MRRRALGAVVGMLALAGAWAAPRPAIWRTYDMIVDFQNLPRTYTCDQLWYEFHGILLRLGAPAASINILPYDCSPAPAGDLKSPHVEIRFQLPFVLQRGNQGRAHPGGRALRPARSRGAQDPACIRLPAAAADRRDDVGINAGRDP